MQTAQPPLLIFYSFPLSGHAHRVALMLSVPDVPHRTTDVDLRGRERKLPAFLALNAFGQVPVIDGGGVVVADSTAVQRWLSAASGPLAA